MTPRLGCIIVTYNAAPVIRACLDSLADARGVQIELVVVDNASTDETLAILKNHPIAPKIIAAQENRGFAAGVNLGLEHLQKDARLDRFWILNPDCIVPDTTPAKLARHRVPFALLGNRIVYAHAPDRIQIDAGTLNRMTGATGNLNLGAIAAQTPPPCPNDADFISGASMVASRAFVEFAGPMPEQYFLYYEEVDWARNRGALPLRFCPEAHVLHSAGSSIGSATLDRGPSALSVYFKHKSRMMFVARHAPWALPVAYLFGVGKLLQHLGRKEWDAVPALVRALHGMPASKAVRDKIRSAPHAAANSRSVSKRPA